MLLSATKLRGSATTKPSAKIIPKRSKKGHTAGSGEIQEQRQIKNYLLGILPSLYEQKSLYESISAEFVVNHPIVALMSMNNRLGPLEAHMKLLQIITTYNL